MSYYPPDQDQSRDPQQRQRGSMSGLKLRLIIAAAIVLFSVVSYYNKGEVNPITGENQRVDMSVKEEILMGLQGAPQMGQPSFRRDAQQRIDEVGARLKNTLEIQLEKNKGIKNPYPFEFHLLADGQTVNAFAIPGGQVFVTEALYDRLTDDGQIAGVLGHEMGHVIQRHGSERMAKGGLTQSIVGAVGVASGDVSGQRAAAWIGNIVNLKYGRADELESDGWGIELMTLAGYNPEHMIEVMDVLEKSSGGAGPPEFMSTHPKPANRREYIREIIQQKFPDGIPDGLR